MNTNGLPLSTIIEMLVDHIHALTHTSKGYPKAGDDEERARRFLAKLGLLEEQPSPWIAYKPGDSLPDVGYCWVVFNLNFYAWKEPRVVLAQVDPDGKGGKIFYYSSVGSVDDIVTHYIPIATPEPPK